MDGAAIRDLAVTIEPESIYNHEMTVTVRLPWPVAQWLATEGAAVLRQLGASVAGHAEIAAERAALAEAGETRAARARAFYRGLGRDVDRTMRRLRRRPAAETEALRAAAAGRGPATDWATYGAAREHGLSYAEAVQWRAYWRRSFLPKLRARRARAALRLAAAGRTNAEIAARLGLRSRKQAGLILHAARTGTPPPLPRVSVSRLRLTAPP